MKGSSKVVPNYAMFPVDLFSPVDRYLRAGTDACRNHWRISLDINYLLWLISYFVLQLILYYILLEFIEQMGMEVI